MQGLSGLAYISPSQGFFHYYSDLIKVISAITIDYTKARFKITTMNPFKDYQENTVDRLLQNAYERQLDREPIIPWKCRISTKQSPSKKIPITLRYSRTNLNTLIEEYKISPPTTSKHPKIHSSNSQP